MFKSVSFILGTLIFASVASAQASEKECKKETPLEKNLSELKEVTEKVEECPTPTKHQYMRVCRNIYEKDPYEGSDSFSYEYQEALWEMSCAKPNESLEVAKEKIQTMWTKNRENFRCYNYTDSVANGKNIAKFSVDSGFTVFISEAVKKYKLDMNFKDPDDNKTILDFIDDQVTIISNTTPVNEAKIIEYRRLYKMLETGGAKRAKDL
jgi:uncharacterized protein involved in high-affinity Fe2+ transport